MTAESYLAIWERMRKVLEAENIEGGDTKKLEEISKLLERVQKGEMTARESGATEVTVVNIALHEDKSVN